MARRILLPVMGLFLGGSASAQEAGFEFRYHTLRRVHGDSLERLAGSYPGLAKLYSIGKSATGTKEIWCIEIGNQDTGAPPRPNPPCTSTETSTPRR